MRDFIEDFFNEHPVIACIIAMLALGLMLRACGVQSCYYHTDPDETCEHVGY